jgi:hypothetical protein
VAGVGQFAATGQDQATRRPGTRQQGGGETAVRHGKPDAHITTVGVPVGGVDADVDRLVGVGERPDPAANGDLLLPGQGDRVDPAADAPLGLTLVHRDIRLPERAGHQRSVQQVAGPHPEPPFRNDVEPEAGGVFVEFAHPGIDRCRVEVRAGQFVERRDDPGIRCVGQVTTAELLGQLPHVPGADVAGLRLPRHHERQILRRNAFREQADLRVAEDQRRCGPVGEHGDAGHNGTRHPPATD